MGDAANPYEYAVERDPGSADGPEIRLVRYGRRRGLFGLRRDGRGTVMFHRTFRPIGELDKLSTYAALLERIAEHGNEGTFGCFVEAETEGGNVEVTLYERWFDGTRLHCDQLAQRTFDASDEETLVQGAEFRAEIEKWAEDQNAKREASYMSAASDQEIRTEQAAERAAAANDLAAILARRS